MNKQLKMYLCLVLFTLVIVYVSAVYILDRRYPVSESELHAALIRKLGRDIQVVETNHDIESFVKVRYEMFNGRGEYLSGTALFKQGINAQYRLEFNSIGTESVLYREQMMNNGDSRIRVIKG